MPGKRKQPVAALPAPDDSIERLQDKARGCHNCDLWEPATQTVFGEGPERARIMLIGEAPGNEEDIAGRPFVGPAGRLLDRALTEAGLSRNELYVTNVMKHFKFRRMGKRRLHDRANAQQQAACRPWLAAELARVQPKFVLTLGAMAAQAMFGRAFRLTKNRGQWQALGGGGRGLATVHPSALLRMPDDTERHAAYAEFVRDLKQLARAARR